MSLEKLLLPPTPEQIEIIKTSIREDTGRYENNIMLLEKWMDCQPSFPKVYDRNLLSVFLRGCKHDMEATKRKIEVFLVCRSTMGDIVNTFKFNKEDQKVADNIMMTIFPKLNNEGCRINYYKLKNNDTALYELKIAMIKSSMFGIITTCKEHMIAGQYYIFDAINFTAAHAPKLLSSNLKKYLYVFQEAFPYRIRKIVIINAGSIIHHVTSVIKLMLKEKIRNRMFVDAGTDILRNDLPLDCLPSDFGGNERSLAELDKEWMECINNHADWFQKVDSLKITGPIPKHLEQTCNFEDGLGVQGSFRQLSID